MKCSQFLRLLRKNGWVIVRQSGSHVVLQNSSKPELGRITFPNHGSKELKKGLEKALRKQAGL